MKNYYTVMEGREFRNLVGGLREVELDKDDSSSEENENEYY